MAKHRTARSRGRNATGPGDIPALGWWDITRRVLYRLLDDSLNVAAPGVAFLMLLALFPGITAAVSIYGLVMDPLDIQRQFETLGTILPSDAQHVIGIRMRDVARESQGALGFGAVASVVLALYGALRGTAALIAGLNLAYGEKEKRSFLRLYRLVWMLTMGGIVFGALAFAVVALLPAVLSIVGFSGKQQLLVTLLSWPLLITLFLIGLSVLYHYGPSRTRPKWRWVTPGALVALVLFLLTSSGFSWYAGNFAQFSEFYGSLGGVVVLMIWLFLTSWAILIGGLVNMETEHQTREDSTVGPAAPMGERGAWAADHLGPIPGRKTMEENAELVDPAHQREIELAEEAAQRAAPGPGPDNAKHPPG